MSEDKFTTRTCKICHQSFPLTLEFFPPHGNFANGQQAFRSQCRECWRKHDRDYHATTEAIEAKRQSRKRRDPEKVKAEKRRSALKHPESQKIRQKRHIEKKLSENPNYLKDKAKADKNAVARATEWIKNNRDIFNSRQRKRHAENPRVKAQSKASSARYRIRKMNAEGSYTDEDILRIFDEQEGMCAYCGIRLFWSIPGDIHIDHIEPLARGGTNYPDNLACTCAGCNLSKGDKSLQEWIDTRGW